jgi:hypothetical protein
LTKNFSLPEIFKQCQQLERNRLQEVGRQSIDGWNEALKYRYGDKNKIKILHKVSRNSLEFADLDFAFQSSPDSGESALNFRNIFPDTTQFRSGGVALPVVAYL